LRVLGSARFGWRRSMGLGLASGFLLLSRQWGVPLLAGVMLFALLVALRHPERRWMIRTLTVSGVVAVIVGGWFYGILYARFGSLREFNRPPAPFSFDNQPREFYTGSGNGKLFTGPVRRAFPNQVGPIFYSEFWGDYWCFFLVYARDPGSGHWVDGYHQEDA